MFLARSGDANDDQAQYQQSKNQGVGQSVFGLVVHCNLVFWFPV